MKTATTIPEQIAKLEERGMTIENKVKASEILLDVGYYRLGFYWFPFEKNYPNKKNRDHTFIEGASFKKAVDLYYLDCGLRDILAPFLYRIEVNMRTFLIYTVSNNYKQRPTWFADNRVVGHKFLIKLQDIYDEIRTNEAISHHHQKYPNDKYAPAWKTLEYMSFGDIITLIENLKEKDLQKKIALHYGIRNLDTFYSYMKTIKVARNLCAHNHNMYDLRLQKSIKAGPLDTKMKNEMHHNLCGVLLVVFYLLNKISENREHELKCRLKTLLDNPEYKGLESIVSFINTIL